MEIRFVDEVPFGFGWIAGEPAFMQRCSHALLVDGGVWLIDPVDGPGVVERVRALGEPAGVVVLFGRHERDSERLAAELGVPRYLARDGIGAAPFQLVDLGRGERALWLPEKATLVVSEALGTVQYMRAPAERLGIHPFRRLAPPRQLAVFEPEHVLVGHGAGLHGPGTAEALRDTLSHGRARMPGWLWSGIRAHVLRRRQPSAPGSSPGGPSSSMR